MYAARGHIQERPAASSTTATSPRPCCPTTSTSTTSIGTSSGTPAAACTSRTPTGTCRSARSRCASTWTARRASICLRIAAGGWHTPGAKDRYGAVLFVEKEGFLPLFRAVKLAERYDLAIMSTQGRQHHGGAHPDRHSGRRRRAGLLHPRLRRHRLHHRRHARPRHPALLLDQRGRDRSRAPARGRQKYGLESEDVYYQGANGRTTRTTTNEIRRKIEAGLKENGATEEEIEFLLRRRVELNAFTSDQLVEWIEEKLEEHGVEKVVPEEDTLAAAARGFARDLIAKRYLDTFADDIDREVDRYAASWAASRRPWRGCSRRTGRCPGTMRCSRSSGSEMAPGSRPAPRPARRDRARCAGRDGRQPEAAMAAGASSQPRSETRLP